MSRFNNPSTGTKTVNLAGGEAFKQNPELELVSILLTSFANDQYYRSSNDTFKKLKELIQVCDKEFVAKAAIYARTEFGMRSITHVVASELAKYIGGESWSRAFYSSIIYRPDDMMEIIAYHKANNGKLSNSMKKGIAKSFDKFDRYSLAKYKGDNKSTKLVDIVNMVHPIPTEKNESALRDLINGDLKSFDTWETEISKTGQVAKNEEEKERLKKEAWIKLIKEKKIGYFALLRNLRNIIEQAPEIVTEALELLTDENRIKKSLVLPFRYITAFFEVEKLSNGSIVRDVLIALNKAVDISISNVPKFDGETLVVLDVSGSMINGNNSKSPHIIGALFSAALIKSNNCDFMTFDTGARYINMNPLDSTLTISRSIHFRGGGTDFRSIFAAANKKYDRIIILSDMQGWVGYNNPSGVFSQYKKATGADPKVYSFDLQGYGSMQFPERNIYCIAGFSEKVFDIMSLLEQDKNALVNKIKEINFC